VSDSLLQRISRGDQRAVRECIDRYSGLVWSLARRFSGSAADAEDATQEVFVNLWRSAARFDPAIASEPTFVAMIARRRLIDRNRARQRWPSTSPPPDPPPEPAAPPAGPRIDLSEEAIRAARALTQLSDEQQRILRLAVHQGLSHDQIAAATGLPLGTVKTHIRRGLLRVRELLAPRREVVT
jgi:RNA polymerase sigma-70 factor (ECF subfamily)